MAQLSPARDTVLFHGAGFSYAVGVPTMAQFGDRSAKQLDVLTARHINHKDPRFSRILEHAALVAESGKVYEAFRHFASRATHLIQTNPDNLEDVFCMAEMLDEASATIMLDGAEWRASQLLRKIKEWLWDIYKKYLPVDRSLDAGVTPHEKPYIAFIAELKKLNLLPRLSVLTTNYDLVFEILCHKANVSCCYPLAGLSKPVYHSSGDEYVHLSEKPDIPVICKLHGSVNFFAPEKPIGSLFIANRWSDEGKKDRPEVLWLKASHNLLRTVGTTPELVPPTYAKLHQSRWLAESFEYAVAALRAAKAIIFIGYSFPPSDGFMVAMMRAAFGIRDPALPAPQIWVFDPCHDVISRYHALFEGVHKAGRLHCHAVPFSVGDTLATEVSDALQQASVI